MNRFIDEELDYLDNLLNDFGTPQFKNLPHTAQDLLSIRFDSLNQNFEGLFRYVFPDKLAFENNISLYPRELHGYLYKNILFNAGKYRSKTDVGAGYVGFGGIPRKNNTENRDRYTGYLPESLEKTIKNTSELLSYVDTTPIESALEYYQRFVRIHPFYDANGRIDRLIVSSYLHHHGYSIDWKRLDKRKAKFFRQLNKCHDRMDSEVSGYSTYLNYLIKSFKKRKFIVSHKNE